MAGDSRVTKVDLNGKPFHFIGIGGIGMSALAYIVAQRQLPVSGSDLHSSHITERLEELGVKVFQGQEASNLDYFTLVSNSHPKPLAVSGGIQSESTGKIANDTNLTDNLPQVICSTAIAPTNLEYQAAKQLDCPIWHRSDLLAALIAEYESIAVSGTHGKTTTSSAIAYMLLENNLDPTIIVGGEVDAWDGNARSGKGQYLVAEADESDGSLIKHHPSIGVITNIELDHPDRYRDIGEVINIFQTFAAQCKTLIGCLDDPIIKEELPLTISYSLDPNSGADYVPRNPLYNSYGSSAEIWERGVCLGKLQLPLLGKHNLSNALAAIAVGRHIGLNFEAIANSLAAFGGTKRRFEHKGEVNKIIFIDDYAHHPKEIEVTLAAAKLRVAGNNSLARVVAIFQPHRYSRTKTFMTEFSQAFKDADVVVVTDIYSAGENNIHNINGQDLARAIGSYHSNVRYHQNLNSLANFLAQEILQPGDLAMFLGAGNLNQSIPKTISMIGGSVIK